MELKEMKKCLKWSIPVTAGLDDKLNEFIKMDFFKTKSEFIRTAVRDRLEEELSKNLLPRNFDEES